MVKLKVIQIAPASMSFFVKGSNKTLKQFILDDWFSLVSQQIKNFYPDIEIEAWNLERSLKKTEEFFHNGIKYKQFPTFLSPIYGLDTSIKMLKELRKEIKKSKKERYKLIIHLHEYHSFHSLILVTLFGKNKIVAQHHGGHSPIYHLKKSGKRKLFFPFFILAQLLENKILRNINVFYALSPQEIEYLKKLAPKSKIKFQTMGIESYYFENMKKNIARKKVKWPLNKKIIISIGRINYEKGTKYLINAMKNLSNIELKIIGYGPQLEEFKEYAKINNLNNIEFLGPVFYKDKLKYLSAADLFVLPSSQEGASVSVMEAMARNLPIVTTDIAGMPLMIKNSQEGLVIRQKNSEDIVKAVREILKWKNKNVRKYAERYRWKKIIDNTVKDYIEI